MTTVEEIKQLKIELPPEEEITGYKSFYNRVVKRAIDFVLALLLTVILSPVLLAVGLMIVVDEAHHIRNQRE